MEKIKKQIQELRDFAEEYSAFKDFSIEAANTIEKLSEELKTANRYIEELNAVNEVAEEIVENLKWIPCSKRLPTREECEKDGFRFILDDGSKRYQGMFDYEKKSFVHFSCFGTNIDKCVIAWRPFPNKYEQ